MDFWQTLMVAATQGGGPGGPPVYTANAVDFDGTNDRLSLAADLTGDADSPFGTLSVWLRLDGGDGATLGIIGNGGDIFTITRSTANKFRLDMNDATVAQEFTYGSVATYTAGATWLNLLASWDLNHVATQKIAWLYINDVSDASAPSNDPALAMSVDYTRTSWGAMARANGTNKFNGCMAEFWFTPGVYIDFSVTANRRKFISDTGKPVDLGSDGSTPTGTAPLVYFKNVAASVGNNSGTGGNFTIGGAPATCSTSPSS